MNFPIEEVNEIGDATPVPPSTYGGLDPRTSVLTRLGGPGSYDEQKRSQTALMTSSRDEPPQSCMAELDIRAANNTLIDVRLSRSVISPSSQNASVLAAGLYRRKRLPVTHYSINADDLPKNNHKLKNKKLSHVKDHI